MGLKDGEIPKYYQPIDSCVNYQAYQFRLPTALSVDAYQQIRAYVKSFGDNLNPEAIKVLHIEHELFFIDFPAYGFPYFKISFYPQTPATKVKNYLYLLNNKLYSLL
jgi:hypothetical protein